MKLYSDALKPPLNQTLFRSVSSRLCIVILLYGLFNEFVFSVEADTVKNRACPDGWSLNSKAIPVTDQSSSIPWGVETDDYQIARSELALTSGTKLVTKTVDYSNATLNDLANDPLTVASHCLQYRNMVVDGVEYFPPSKIVEPRPALGWIPASVF